MSYQAYQSARTSAETSSQVEYRLLAQVTSALMVAQEKDYSGTQLVDSLDWNRRVWSTFSNDCGTKGNNLPAQLRANIISLALWVSKHSSKVVQKKAEIEDLIKINRLIMEGLADQVKLQQSKPEPSNEPIDTSY